MEYLQMFLYHVHLALICSNKTEEEEEMGKNNKQTPVTAGS